MKLLWKVWPSLAWKLNERRDDRFIRMVMARLNDNTLALFIHPANGGEPKAVIVDVRVWDAIGRPDSFGSLIVAHDHVEASR